MLTGKCSMLFNVKLVTVMSAAFHPCRCRRLRGCPGEFLTPLDAQADVHPPEDRRPRVEDKAAVAEIVNPQWPHTGAVTHRGPA